ncbi:MAG: bifunctional phosphopantothenoylcysteine decarboxylase/phosphopantothenate--cysteine ligase CoaBC [Bacteroidota bacterium]|nr:bifunctional phosphopantothenoylcysteine decarboxylase/phosphopantothenate--cysteine ligase CoaBC [Bacteroidota bacterium]
MLTNKNILVGVTGSIAAYKAAYLVRLLIKEGANVRVIMTPFAKEFITPLTLSTLSGYPVQSDNFNKDNGSWHSHIDYGSWADLMLFAPATANTIGKMANGVCDNFLIACFLAARCPVYIAPAMDVDMLMHFTTQDNLSRLSEHGVKIITPAEGELASGLFGAGRMEEPEIIVNVIKEYFRNSAILSGRKVLVTAGPTYEAIDPVRYIGNHSSGKMGYAIAQELLNCGANVELISGPVNLNITHKNLKLTKVVNAEEMHAAVIDKFPECNIAIMSAAVADYTPVKICNEKIKKADNNLQIELKHTIDILGDLGKMKKDKQILVGFALETENESENAFKKLVNKNLDFIVLNSLKEKGAGFGFDTNKVSIIDKNKFCQNFDLKSKTDVAKDIINKIIQISI